MYFEMKHDIAASILILYSNKNKHNSFHYTSVSHKIVIDISFYLSICLSVMLWYHELNECTYHQTFSTKW